MQERTWGVAYEDEDTPLGLMLGRTLEVAVEPTTPGRTLEDIAGILAGYQGLIHALCDTSRHLGAGDIDAAKESLLAAFSCTRMPQSWSFTWGPTTKPE